MTASHKTEIEDSTINQPEIISTIELCPGGTIQKWSNEAEELREYKQEEIIGQHFNIFYLPVDRQKKLPQHLLDVAEKQGIAIYEGLQVRKRGSTFKSLAVITPIYENDGKTIIGFKHQVKLLS